MEPEGVGREGAAQPVKILTACNRDCPDACGLIATVEDGRVVRLEGDPRHPVTRGFLCYRTSRFLSRQYDPSRLTTPLLRRGTDFRPVFTYVDKLIEQREFENLKGLIYFTDGYGTYPSRKPNYDTAFVFLDEDYVETPDVPAWAIKLVLSTDDVMERGAI